MMQFPDILIGRNPADNTNKRREEFDQRFSALYVGMRINSWSNVNKLYETKQLNRSMNPAFFGNTGFKSEYGGGNSNTAAADQTHHFAAYFSAGLNGMFTASRLHIASENEKSGGEPDRALGRAAYDLGAEMRGGIDDLKRVGELIRTRICDGPGRGL